MAALAVGLPAAALAAGFEAKEICACEVTGLSADGSAAVGIFSSYTDYREPFRWTAANGLQRLGRRPTDLNTSPGRPAISANGRVVAATIMAADGTHAVQGRWQQGQGWQELGPLPDDATVHAGAASTVMGMSPDGGVVVGTYARETAAGAEHSAARWTAAGGVVDLGGVTPFSEVHGASRGGKRLVGMAADPESLLDGAVVWNQRGDGTWLGRRKPSRATAINAGGTFIVGAQGDFSTGAYGAMLWRLEGRRWEAKMLGAPQGWRGPSIAHGVSADGNTVVGQASRYSDWLGCLDCQGGWVWTPETGMLPAHEFFGGVQLGTDRAFRIYNVAAVSHDGSVFAVVARRQDDVEPSLRSFLVRRVPGGQ